MNNIFKAYDIRGIYPDEIDTDLARRIGYEFARMIDADSLCICRDVRASSPEIAAAVIDGVCTAGTTAIDAGTTTTPMSYYAVGKLDLDGGIMITASHNPPEYTGMKLSREKAIPVSGETGIKELEKRVRDGEQPDFGEQRKKASRESINMTEEYGEHLKSFLKHDPGGIAVAADGANGAVAAVFESLVGDLDVEWTTLCMEPDGTFPNHPPNPLEKENTRDLAGELESGDYKFGIAFDGDGDRAIFLDDQGQMISSDIITAIISEWYLEEIEDPSIVYDLRSSRIVPETIRKGGGRPIRERVGHAFIKETMRNENAVFGGELSGHYYFRDHYYADSALVALMHVLDQISETGASLAELAEPFQKYQQSGEINFEVEEKDQCIDFLSGRYSEFSQDRLDGLTVEAENWWFNLRKSNTEPLLRLNLEADTTRLLQEKLEEVKLQIRSFEAREIK